jgi:shikimate kinase
MSLVLFGFKCCGKSTCGSLAAERLDRTFVDIDHVIEAIYYDPLQGRPEKLSCREIYKKHGEHYFRLLEREAVHKARYIKHGVIATGGGALLDFFNYVELKQLGTLVYLKTPRDVLLQRLRKLPQLPSYLDHNDLEGSFDRVYEARVETYEHVADLILDTSGQSIAQTVEALCELYQTCK